MQIGRIEGATRLLGKSQGYLGLPIRDGEADGFPTMTSSWQPTPAEIEAILAGASIHVVLVGTAHPPIRVEVGEPPKG